MITNIWYQSKKSTSWQPTDIAGCQLWLKADAGITKDGSNYVSQWADQSGNGNHAVQATGSAQPLWVDNQLNGKPILRFNNAQYLLGSLIQANTKISIFIVSKIASYNDYDRIYALKEVGILDWKSGPLMCVYSGAVLYNYEEFYDKPLAANTIDTNYRLYEYVDNNTNNITSYLNSNVVDSVARLVTYKSDEYYIGVGNDGEVRYFLTGDVVEFIVYFGANIDATNRQQVENYLNTKYALW